LRRTYTVRIIQGSLQDGRIEMPMGIELRKRHCRRWNRPWYRGWSRRLSGAQRRRRGGRKQTEGMTFTFSLGRASVEEKSNFDNLPAFWMTWGKSRCTNTITLSGNRSNPTESKWSVSSW
jgi:hypothetical protein